MTLKLCKQVLCVFSNSIKIKNHFGYLGDKTGFRRTGHNYRMGFTINPFWEYEFITASIFEQNGISKYTMGT